MTALDHLRKLISEEPIYQSGRKLLECIYCDYEHESEATHAPDCPWVAAKAFVEDLDRRTDENARLAIRIAGGQAQAGFYGVTHP